MTARALGFFGATVLVLGVFAPVISAPIVGSVNYFRNGEGDGVVLIAFGLISFLLLLANRVKWLFTTGALAIAVLAFTYWNVTSRIEDLKDRVNSDLADNPFRGIADAAAQSVQLEWGWAILVAGAIVLVAASLVRGAVPTATRKCRYCAEMIQPDAIVCKHCGRNLSEEEYVEGAPIWVYPPSSPEPMLPGRVLAVTVGLLVVAVVAFGLREYIGIAISMAGS